MDFEQDEYFWAVVIEKQDYSGASIGGKEFDGCTFRDCNFTEATFSRCTFSDCLFEHCNLSLVDLDYSRFSDVEFIGCKLVGVNWTRANWPQMLFSSPLSFVESILNESSFFGLTLQELVLEGCKAVNVDFREGDFTSARFGGSDFSGALFFKTNLTSVDFVEATDYAIDLFSNEIRHAKFERFEALRLLECLDVELVD